MDEKYRLEQRKYNPYFLKVYNDALEKMIQKREEFKKDGRHGGSKGDGWVICEKKQLEDSLHTHAEKPYWTLKQECFKTPYCYGYEDLLDIINFCLFLGASYNKEEKLKELWDATPYK